ncbi:MAG: hypothetical protein CMJ49_07055 [Planctomycetaceae bacterium]|nr:hypothetical protein [Planctomycetaceae bacterium]
MIRTAAWMLSVLLIVGVWWLARHALHDYVGHARSALPRVVLAETPAWMTAPLAREIRQLVAASVDPDPLDAASLDATSTLLASNPWIAQVHRVRREYDGVITVDATFREPAAVIAWDGGFELIDGHGCRLPATYDESQLEALELPVISGVAARPPRPGVIWVGTDVQAGLKLALLMETTRYARQIQAVDVGNHDGRIDSAEPHLQLVTRHAQVRWGRCPGDELYYEPDTATKLRHLERVNRSYGSIDAGGQIVDVFGDAVLIHPNTPTSMRLTGGP